MSLEDFGAVCKLRAAATVKRIFGLSVNQHTITALRLFKAQNIKILVALLLHS